MIAAIFQKADKKDISILNHRYYAALGRPGNRFKTEQLNWLMIMTKE